MEAEITTPHRKFGKLSHFGTGCHKTSTPKERELCLRKIKRIVINALGVQMLVGSESHHVMLRALNA
jgi:hypothetical protein